MPKITYTNEVVGSYSSQTNCEAGIYVDGEIAGIVQYVLYDEELTISYIFVRPEYRRQGYGSRLMKFIQQENPDYKYKPSMMTDDGADFNHKNLSLENKFISFNNWLLEEKKPKKKEDDDEEPKFGCIMMDATIKNWEDFHLSGIDEKDISLKPYDESYGLEENPHVTILYGIHEEEVDSQRMADMIEHYMKPLTVTIKEIDVFSNKEYDIVKYNVPLSGQLIGYRDLFIQIPNTQTFPEFHPHMTIAYVKPGTGKKYKTELREPFQVTFTKGVYSWHPSKKNPDKTSRKVINLIKKEPKKEVLPPNVEKYT
jgi:2'-5' RNA ligase/predicted GNAT family acetyltransferase